MTADALSSLDGVFTFLFGPVTIDDAFHILLIVTMATPWLCDRTDRVVAADPVAVDAPLSDLFEPPR